MLITCKNHKVINNFRVLRLCKTPGLVVCEAYPDWCLHSLKTTSIPLQTKQNHISPDPDYQILLTWMSTFPQPVGHCSFSQSILTPLKLSPHAHPTVSLNLLVSVVSKRQGRQCRHPAPATSTPYAASCTHYLSSAPHNKDSRYAYSSRHSLPPSNP